MIGKLAQGLKDSALSLALKSIVNDRLPQYGEVLECQVDTEDSKLYLRAQLRGEPEPIEAILERYEILREGETCYIRLHSFSCSREWIATLLNHAFANKQYKLPSMVSALL